MKVEGLEILRCDAGWRNYHFLKLTNGPGCLRSLPYDSNRRTEQVPARCAAARPQVWWSVSPG